MQRKQERRGEGCGAPHTQPLYQQVNQRGVGGVRREAPKAPANDMRAGPLIVEPVRYKSNGTKEKSVAAGDTRKGVY